MKTTKKILAVLASALMLLGLLAGCGEEKNPAQTNPQDTNTGSSLTEGMLVFTANASVNISYDAEGLVVSVNGSNAEGIELADNYKDFEGKSCAAVIKDLVTAAVEGGYFTRNVIIKQALGSALPGTNFLDTIYSEAQAAADAADVLATVILVAEEDLDSNGYINLAAAKKILMSDLALATTSVFDGEPAPEDGAYTFYLEAENVKGFFSVDAVSGVTGKLTEEEVQGIGGETEETVPTEESYPVDISDVTVEVAVDPSTPAESIESHIGPDETESGENAGDVEVTPDDGSADITDSPEATE